MRYNFLILFFSLLFFGKAEGQAYTPLPNCAIDTTFSFPKSNLQLRIRIFDPVTKDPDINTAEILLINKYGKVVFSDSLHMGRMAFDFQDYNGDGIEDLILHRHIHAARSNMSYNLYLVSTNRQSLRKVKGFEDVLNPTYDLEKRLIKSSYLYGAYMGWSYFKIDRNGKLHKVSRNYKERIG